MSWIEVEATFPSAPDDLSPAIEMYRTHGIENTMQMGDERLVGCIVDVPGSDAVVAALRSALESMGASVETRVLPETNWEEAWKQFFHPRRVGKHWVVRPTWEEYDAGPADRVIVLDPGQAFGTGDHPTTRMCLELMEPLDLAGRPVADVGCGSGILAVGACMMGADPVEAVDIDPIAVEVAKENAARNGVSFLALAGDGLSAFRGEAASPEGVPQDETPLTGLQVDPAKPSVRQYDLVLSNIISATLVRIAADISLAVVPGGAWIVSGIIESNWPDVREVAGKVGFILVDERHEDGWVAARFTRGTIE
ncbi:50S ribosomal protein L11 methyltransferase [bacterium]|nr:MAG: 50S ribosomal protein L11 methyltransferase [bacterium]